MPLAPAPACLKLLYAYDQWHSSRAVTASPSTTTTPTATTHTTTAHCASSVTMQHNMNCPYYLTWPTCIPNSPSTKLAGQSQMGSTTHTPGSIVPLRMLLCKSIMVRGKYVRVFRCFFVYVFALPGVLLGFMPLLRLKRCHACD
jgi:hypothetical protein